MGLRLVTLTAGLALLAVLALLVVRQFSPAENPDHPANSPTVQDALALVRAFSLNEQEQAALGEFRARLESDSPPSDQEADQAAAALLRKRAPQLAVRRLLGEPHSAGAVPGGQGNAFLYQLGGEGRFLRLEFNAAGQLVAANVSGQDVR